MTRRTPRPLAARYLVAAALAVAALAASPAPAPAASPPLVVPDPKGDVIAADPRPSMDITSLRIEVGKGTDGAPALIVSLTMAAPPEQQAAQYLVQGTIQDCGEFNFAYRPGTAYSRIPGTSPMQLFVCDDTSDTGSRLLFTRNASKGSTLTWVVAVDSLPRSARRGRVMHDLVAVTSLADPVFGIYGNGYADAGEGLAPHDEVRTPKSFTFA